MTDLLLIGVHALGLVIGGYCGWVARRDWERNKQTPRAEPTTYPGAVRGPRWTCAITSPHEHAPPVGYCTGIPKEH